MTDRSPAEQSTLVLAVIDLLAAAALVAGLGLVVVAAVTLGVGYDLVAVKQVLFVVGLLTVGVAVLQRRSNLELRRDDGAAPAQTSIASTPGPEPEPESRLRLLLEAVLPDAWQLPRRDRFPEMAKLALAGLLFLLVSYVMEAGFGIGA